MGSLPIDTCIEYLRKALRSTLNREALPWEGKVQSVSHLIWGPTRRWTWWACNGEDINIKPYSLFATQNVLMPACAKSWTCVNLFSTSEVRLLRISELWRGRCGTRSSEKEGSATSWPRLSASEGWTATDWWTVMSARDPIREGSTQPPHTSTAEICWRIRGPTWIVLQCYDHTPTQASTGQSWDKCFWRYLSITGSESKGGLQEVIWFITADACRNKNERPKSGKHLGRQSVNCRREMHSRGT